MACFVSFSTQAAPVDCSSLVQSLKEMRQAQSQLLRSFSKKSEVFAMVLDQNARKLEKTASTGRKLEKSDLKTLDASAQAYRNHQKKEAALIASFESASDELLEQVQNCLQPRKRNSQN